jgi:transcriptional regulator with XRE-family HTH domain
MYPNLKLQIWRTGMRQNRLASMLGVDETVLSKIVNGFRDPSPTLRQKIAGLLQSDADWLFERADGHPGDQPRAKDPNSGLSSRSGQ